jgi:hypothetical protein
MSVSGKTRRAHGHAKASAPRDRAAVLYDRHAPGLYRQALLTLDDEALAEQAVCDVILAECRRPAAPEDDRDDTNRRLAVSAYRRCRELADGPASENHRAGQQPAGGIADRVDPDGFLSREERGALGLVLFGGLESSQACGELMMSPPDLAVLLRTTLHRLAAPLKVSV